MAAATATVSATTTTQTDLNRLAEHYEFREPDAVIAFVRAHPKVVAPLLEAVDVVPRFFGAGTPLVLEVERDREVDDRFDLFALIRTDKGVDAALASLYRFQHEWWFDALPRVATELTFGLEYA